MAVRSVPGAGLTRVTHPAHPRYFTAPGGCAGKPKGPNTLVSAKPVMAATRSPRRARTISP